MSIDLLDIETAPRKATLSERLGFSLHDRRRRLENKPQRLGKGKKWIPLQALEPAMSAARSVLERLGIFHALAHRALAADVIENQVFVRGLDDAVSGLRILHLSDLHIDGTRGFGRRLAETIAPLEFDYVAISGDLRLDTHGPIDGVLREMEPLVSVLRRCRGVFAVLGNHDVLDLVEPLEMQGVRYLLNENVVEDVHGHPIVFSGVDDAHYYGTDDMSRALEEVPIDHPTVFLCHSPDLVREAAENYVDLYLCGHTHGGQLCLPGGRPLVSNANCERRFIRGAWRYGSMNGYTSKGVGWSGVPLRSFCRAEIVVHVLRRERRNRCRVEADAARENARS